MPELRKIRDDFALDLGAEFLISDVPSELLHEFPETCWEIFAPDLETTGLDSLIAKTIEDNERCSTGMDLAMAISLHRTLPLTRRQASDSGFWSWLGVIHAPDFVAWRWAPNPGTGMRSRERYSGSRVRQTFARLWWAAELTRDGTDYSLTAELLNMPGFQDVYEAIFGRAFGNYRPAMAAFVTVIEGKSEKQIRRLARELGYALTTTVLETATEAELKNLMAGIFRKIELAE
jgi:hypothetical protein